MDFWLNLRLRIRDFFTKYRLIIIIAIIVIAVIFTISFALKANNARRMIGSNTIVGVSVYNVKKHIHWIKRMENTLVLNAIDYHEKFFIS